MTTERRVSVDAELRPGERVLWLGQPQGSLLTGADAYLIPFSILWLAFACFWESAAIKGGPVMAAVFGLPFIATGLYFTVGRLWVKARRRRETVYAVTTERVLEKSKRSLRTLSLTQLPALEVTSSTKGRGRIVFGSFGGQAAGYANTGLESFGGSGSQPMAIYDIPDAQNVGRIIEDAAQSARRGEIEHTRQLVSPADNSFDSADT